MKKTFRHTQPGDEIVMLSYDAKEREYQSMRCEVVRWIDNQIIYKPTSSCGVTYDDYINRDDMNSDSVYIRYDSEVGDYSILFTSTEAAKEFLQSEREDFIYQINQTIEML